MSKENQNIDLIYVLRENIKNPFIAVSAEGNIITYNKQAGQLFNIKEKSGNIFDFFKEDSSFELSKLFEDVIAGKKSLVKNIFLTFTNGTSLKCQATINAFSGNLIFCTFKPEEHDIKISEITRLKIRKAELSALIKNKKIEEILDAIKELFPFTVIGKEKIRKYADELEELFWIKNSEGVFILVNKRLAQNLGLDSSQLEGKPEDELLPGYLKEIYRSLENYIKDSQNVIVLEGIPIQGLSALNNFQTIEIPLNDSEGNLAAIIGISQKADEYHKLYEEKEDQDRNILENIPAPVAITDSRGIIKHSSKEFCKLFSDEFSELKF